jgi:hypothetical protein
MIEWLIKIDLMQLVSLLLLHHIITIKEVKDDQILNPMMKNKTFKEVEVIEVEVIH